MTTTANNVEDCSSCFLIAHDRMRIRVVMRSYLIHVYFSFLA